MRTCCGQDAAARFSFHARKAAGVQGVFLDVFALKVGEFRVKRLKSDNMFFV
jgi:hypothetical protein